jgi:hypothetical protein
LLYTITSKTHFLSIITIESILFPSIFHLLHLISTSRHCKYYMYYTMRLNKHYFIVMCLDVVCFDHPTLLMVLVTIQSSIDS